MADVCELLNKAVVFSGSSWIGADPREACVAHSSGYRRISQGLFGIRTGSLKSEGLVNGMSRPAFCLSWWGSYISQEVHILVVLGLGLFRLNRLKGSRAGDYAFPHQVRPENPSKGIYK